LKKRRSSIYIAFTLLQFTAEVDVLGVGDDELAFALDSSPLFARSIYCAASTAIDMGAFRTSSTIREKEGLSRRGEMI